MSTISGDVRVARAFPSRILGNRRDVAIYLPPSYREPGNQKRYPVLYVHDGQNVFDADTSAFGTEWQLDETAEALSRMRRMQEVIIVAPYNTPQRTSEYTPVADAEHGGGDADRYGDFLMRELKPWMDRHYRTVADAAHTGIMGSSLGGLCSLYLSCKHPDVFGVAGVLSPSLWWADRQILQSVKDLQGPKKMWVSMGTGEGQEPGAMLKDSRALREILLGKGYREGENLVYHEVPGGSHNEASWAEESRLVLPGLFPA